MEKSALVTFGEGSFLQSVTTSRRNLTTDFSLDKQVASQIVSHGGVGGVSALLQYISSSSV